MHRNIMALVAGGLFGLGLSVSQMINPAKVIGFLDVSGGWDPSLALVLIAAVAVSSVGYRLALRRTQPFSADVFHLPTRKNVDLRLTTGALIFGIGWGLAGYCPGPAIVAAAIGHAEPYLFIAAMIAGSLIQAQADRWGMLRS